MKCSDPPGKAGCCRLALGHPCCPWETPVLDEVEVQTALEQDQPFYLTLGRPPGPELSPRLPGPALLELSLHGQLTALLDWVEGRGPWSLALTPLIPYLDDDLAELEQRIEAAKARGCQRVLAGCLTVCSPQLEQYLREQAPQDADRVLELVKAGPPADYRHRLYGLIRGLCDRHELPFAVWEWPFGGTPFNRFLASAKPCCRGPGL